MTNFEFYKDEILIYKSDIGVTKNGIIGGCSQNIKCDDCIFRGHDSCYDSVIEWLYEEYNPKPQFEVGDIVVKENTRGVVIASEELGDWIRVAWEGKGFLNCEDFCWKGDAINELKIVPIEEQAPHEQAMSEAMKRWRRK